MTTLCPGCFEEEVPSGGEPCPTCGWSGGQDRPPLALPVQTELKGRYQAGRVLGEPGGFGVTYLGYDRLEGQKVAIKEYFPREVAGRDTDGRSVVAHSGEGSEEFRYGKEQFLGEAQTLARFDHANIVSVRDFFEENGTAYLVMEYYEGKTLEAYLEEEPGGRMEPEAATEVMLRVLDGLKEMHQEGYLHRDIKPENIYLTKEGRPILIDFGAARQAVGERSRSLSVVMTPGYAPYEQYRRDGDQGPWTDIYGCGATLYRMVTGQKPPPATDRVMDDTLKAPNQIAPQVPNALSDAIVEALATGNKERISAVEALQEQLQKGLTGGLTSSSDSTTEPQNGGEKRKKVAAEQVTSPGRKHQSFDSEVGETDEADTVASTGGSQREKGSELASSWQTKRWSRVLIGILVAAALGLVGMAVVSYLSENPRILEQTSAYESLIQSDKEVRQAWAEVQENYQLRADLIQDLLETVKRTTDFDRETLQAVAKAQVKAASIEVSPEDLDTPPKIRRFQRAQFALGKSLGRLLAVSENYPKLQAAQGFSDLQAQLEGTENRIAVARRDYNNAVRQYNTELRSFPIGLFADVIGFQSRTPLGADPAPDVSLN